MQRWLKFQYTRNGTSSGEKTSGLVFSGVLIINRETTFSVRKIQRVNSIYEKYLFVHRRSFLCHSSSYAVNPLATTYMNCGYAPSNVPTTHISRSMTGSKTLHVRFIFVIEYTPTTIYDDIIHLTKRYALYTSSNHDHTRRFTSINSTLETIQYYCRVTIVDNFGRKRQRYLFSYRFRYSSLTKWKT